MPGNEDGSHTTSTEKSFDSVFPRDDFANFRYQDIFRHFCFPAQDASAYTPIQGENIDSSRLD